MNVLKFMPHLPVRLPGGDMESKDKSRSRRLFPLVFMVLAIGLACSCPGLSLISTPTLSPTPYPTPPPTITAQTHAVLNPVAPWMIIGSTDGLYAANSDGTGMLQLVTGNQWQSDFTRSIQPKGNLVAVITSGADPYHNLALNLLSLPDGSMKKITDLSNPQTEPGPGEGPASNAMEAMRAISESPSYNWSPDGTKLAFIGAMDGPSVDVYLYDIASNSITRVSTDPAQDFYPTWSPDGNHLLFLGADGFGTGAGVVMNGVWSADGDGSNVTLLYPTTSAGELMIGWRDNETVVLETWSAANGPAHLRLYNIITKDTTILQDGYSLAAVADAGNLVLSTDAGAVLFTQDGGLYLLPSQESQPTQLSESQVDQIKWNRDSSMFEVRFNDGSLATFQSDGSHRQDSPADFSSGGYAPINLAMYGLIWAWTEGNGDTPGVWINGPGLENIPQIYDGSAVAPLWDPHNNLTFFSGSTLYRVTFDSYYTDLSPVIDISGDAVNASWVGSNGFNIYGP